MKRFSLPMLVGLALVLGGCAGVGGDPTSAPTVPDSTPTPTSSGDPGPVVDPDDPSTWLITAAGVGPVELGMTQADAVAAVPAYSDVTDRSACPNPAVTFLGPQGSDSSDAPLLLVTDDGGSVIGVAVTAAGPATAEGIEVGSDAAEIPTTYPDAESSKRGPTSVDNQWTVEGDPGWISFDYMPADSPASVYLISVIDGGLPPYEFCG